MLFKRRFERCDRKKDGGKNIPDGENTMYKAPVTGWSIKHCTMSNAVRMENEEVSDDTQDWRATFRTTL